MIRLVVFLYLPVTVWTVLNALPVTRVLYEHGRFLATDSAATARVLGIYGVAILPNALAIVMLRCLLALEDTVTPLIAELISLAVFVPAATFLSARWGIAGLATGRSATFFLTSAILIGVLWKRWRLLAWDFELATFLAKVATASAVMGAVSWSAFHVLEPTFDAGGAPVRFGVIVVVLAVSGATYMALARLFQLEEGQRVMTTALGFLPGKRGA
jgi:putative peptidoglycan lipid II flippase